MPTLCELFLERERTALSPYAFLTENTKGRRDALTPNDFRTEFQRDRDRIIHSKAFRRLTHKTQVFFSPVDEHYRTRMTHTLEVTQIARILARALSLNEDLTEAIAMGHDLGHTPFGHAGEEAFRECFDKNFAHYRQSLRVVDEIEKLNLTYEVRDGILKHSGKTLAETREGIIVKFADRIAYANHDFDDACRAGVLTEEDIPFDIRYVLGDTSYDRMNTMAHSIIENGAETIQMSPDVARAADDLRSFMFSAVYTSPVVKAEERKVKDLIIRLYEYYLQNIDELPLVYRENMDRDGKETCVVDYVSGMTDRFAIETFEKIYIPTPWER